MKTNRFIPILTGCLVLLTSAGRLPGQLFVDNGGPRDIFFDASSDGESLSGFVGKFDTAEKSFSASYFGRPAGLKGNVLFGFKAKVDAVDGLEELLKFQHWPRVEVSFLGNWYGHTSGDRGGRPWLWSITPRVAGTFAEYELVDPDSTVTPRKVGVQHFTTGTAAVTFSVVLPNGDALAFNVGADRGSNYEDLPKVEITDAPGGQLPDGTPVEGKKRTLRLGRLEKITSYPLQLTYVRVFGVTKLARFLPKSDENSKYDLLVAPYAKVSAGSGGGSANAVGMNFTLRQLSNSVGPNGEPPLEKEYSDQALSFPYAFFVERRNVLGNQAGETKAGVAMVFSWK